MSRVANLPHFFKILSHSNSLLQNFLKFWNSVSWFPIYQAIILAPNTDIATLQISTICKFESISSNDLPVKFWPLVRNKLRLTCLEDYFNMIIIFQYSFIKKLLSSFCILARATPTLPTWKSLNFETASPNDLQFGVLNHACIGR
jgi:hypothetical protein